MDERVGDVGDGGKKMMEFLEKFVFSKIDVKSREDAAIISDEMVITTDSHTIEPIIFPGGTIGKLAICGSANDVAVMGAQPSSFLLSLVMNEELEKDKFLQVISDISQYMKEIDAELLGGDTKTMKGDFEMIINTACIGKRNEWLEHNLEVVRSYRQYPHSWIRNCGACKGEAVIITSNIAEHSVAVLLARENLDFELEASSDCKHVWHFVRRAMEEGGITSMKDATRGGIAAALNEIAEQSNVGMVIEESKIPIRQEVRNFCEVLGLDPFSMANEGVVVMTVVKEKAEDVRQALHKAGEKNAAIAGYTTEEHEEVVIQTTIGGKRILQMPYGSMVPRIC